MSTRDADVLNSQAGGDPHRRGSSSVALVLWPSFLAACVASALFFTAVDPELLRDAGPRLFANLDRESGYALGFLFFWAIAAFSSALSLFLASGWRREPVPIVPEASDDE